MAYITTNIRISEDDYLKLKEEAARRRKSLAAVIREKLNTSGKAGTSVETLLKKTKEAAHINAQHIGKWDSLKALNEIRSQSL